MPTTHKDVQVKRERRIRRESDVDVSSTLRATNNQNAGRSSFAPSLSHREGYHVMCEEIKGNRPGVECRHLAGDETAACSP